jgi:ribosome-binding protein aMBF1 (putative translation factor)
MDTKVAEKSWKDKYFELRTHHEKEKKWLRNVIAKLELELEEYKMGTKKTKEEARRRFQEMCDSIPDPPTGLFAQAHPYVDTTSQSDEYFVQTLNDIQEYIGISDEDLADSIRISLPSLKRWKNGQNLPHRFARKSIFQYLDKKAFETYLDKDE